ncbi:hypothetical protein LZ30DRAFT_740277, partial [Colletotrichum cereale]
MRPPAELFARGPRRNNPRQPGRSRHPSGQHHFYYPSSHYFPPSFLPSISSNPPLLELPSIEALKRQEQQSRRPEPCRKCSARFPSKSALFRHIYANNCTHRCRLCRQDFPSRNALFRHLPDCDPPSPSPSYSLPSSTSPSLPSLSTVSSPPSTPMSERSISPVLPAVFSAAKFNIAIQGLNIRIAQTLSSAYKWPIRPCTPQPVRYTKPPPLTPLL